MTSPARLPHPMTWFAVAAPGTETVVLDEIEAVPGVRRPRGVPGGVEFEGDWPTALRANLGSRSATRIWLRVARGRARDFDTLCNLCASAPWEAVLAPGVPLRIDVAQRGCRLYHTGAVRERLAETLRARSDPPASLAQAADAGGQRILARGDRDVWTLSVDSSGERLHQRGWRTETGAAALRESLAASVLSLCRWDPQQALVDGMCGSGTFAIEAAQLALGIAPGLERGFALERWPAIPGERVAEIRERARRRTAARPAAPILAADADAEALERARRNAGRAGVGDVIRFEHRELAKLEPPAATGLILLDPPYGRRLLRGSRAALEALYSDVGRSLAGPFRTWRAGLLVPDRGLARKIHARAEAIHTLRHGGLEVELRVYGARPERPAAPTPEP